MQHDLRAKCNEQKIILKGNLNRFLYICSNFISVSAKSMHFCMWKWLAAALMAMKIWASLGWGLSVVLLAARQHSRAHLFVSIASHDSSLGMMCLHVLDLCFSALRTKYGLYPFLEKILKNKAVCYQARLRIFGRHLRKNVSSASPTALWRTNWYFKSFFFCARSYKRSCFPTPSVRLVTAVNALELLWMALLKWSGIQVLTFVVSVFQKGYKEALVGSVGSSSNFVSLGWLEAQKGALVAEKISKDFSCKEPGRYITWWQIPKFVSSTSLSLCETPKRRF